MDTGNGVSVYSLTQKPFAAHIKEKTVKYKREVTLLRWLTPDYFLSGRHYYFMGVLERESFEPVSEMKRPSQLEYAAYVSQAKTIQRLLVGTTEGRVIVLAY